MTQVCEHCGAVGDGEEDWLDDHRDVCLKILVPCPSRAYGCTEFMPRNKVTQHLKICPASAVLCCYSQQGAARYEEGFERWIFSKKPHIKMTWVNGRQVSEVVLESQCCDRPLRRCDLERHLNFAHADHNMVADQCPLHHEHQASSNNRTRSPSTQVEVTPASPLYPTSKSFGRAPPRLLPRLMKLNQSLSDEDSNPSGGNSPIRASSPIRSIPGSPERELLPCHFLRRPVAPQFCRTAPRSDGGCAPSSLTSASSSAGAAKEVFAKADCLSRILGALPVGMLPMLCCVCRAISDASEDPSLNAHHRLLSFEWERITWTDDNGQPRSGWRERLVWIKPEVPVPLQKWEVDVRAPCVGKHLETCSAKGQTASLSEMKVAAVKLRDATAPDGTQFFWQRPEEVEAEAKRKEARKKREEEEAAAEEEVRWAPPPPPPEEDPKLTEGPEVDAWFGFVMAQDLEGMRASLDEHNVDINAKNAEGWSALAVAQENLKMRSERWLKERGGARRILPRGAAGMMFGF